MVPRSRLSLLAHSLPLRIAFAVLITATSHAASIRWSDTYGARIIGRTEPYRASQESHPSTGRVPEARVMNWSGTTLEVGFVGETVKVALAYEYAMFQVLIDDIVQPDLALFGIGGKALKDSIVVFSGKSGNPRLSSHVLRLTKRSDAFRNLDGIDPAGLVVVKKIVGKAGPLPPRKTRRIEFLGNSATSGVGTRDSSDLATTSKYPVNLFTTDFLSSASSYAAQFFGAEIHVVSVGGRGLFQNYPGTGTENMAQTFLHSTLQLPYKAWNFSSWKPDIVVIELGSNDYGAISGGLPLIDSAAWIGHWLDLLETIHSQYGDVPVALVNGPGANDYFRFANDSCCLPARTHIRKQLKIAAALAKFHGMRHVRYVELSGISADGFGAAYHSNTVQSRRNALELEAAIAQMMRWETPTSLAGRVVQRPMTRGARPISGALVEFLGKDGNPFHTTKTDQDGEYTLDTALPYDAIRVSYPGHWTKTVTRGSERIIATQPRPITYPTVIQAPHDPPVLQLGPEEELASANVAGSDLEYFPDEATSLLPSRKGSVRMLLAGGVSSWLLTGTGNLGNVEWTSASQVLSPDTNSPLDNGYAGFSGSWDDGRNRVWGIYHAEDHKGLPNIPGTQIPGFYATIALATSFDSGKTWNRRGPLIRSAIPKDPAPGSNGLPRTVQGAGESGTVASPDGKWLFVDWTDHSNDEAKICLARIPIAKDTLDIDGCRKWNGSDFAGSCLDGADVPVLQSQQLPVPHQKGSVAEGHPVWIPKFQMYAMVFAYQPGGPDFSMAGTWIGFSKDMVHWGHFHRLLDDHPMPWPGQSVRWEATFFLNEGSPDEGWLVYGRSHQWPTFDGQGEGHSAVRRRVKWLNAP